MWSRRKVMRAGVGAAAGGLVGRPFAKAASDGGKSKAVLVFADTFSAQTEQFVVTKLDLFKKLIEEYSGGAIKVRLSRGGVLGSQGDLPQQVQTGAIQGCLVSMQNFVPYAPAFNVLDIPYLFPKRELFDRFLNSAKAQELSLLTEPKKRGLKVLQGMWTNTGYRVFCTSKKRKTQVKVPADLDGLKVRVTNSRVEQAIFGATKASPVAVEWSETYMALQQGTVDALSVGLGPLTANRIDEVIATASRLRMNFNAHVAMVSQKWFDSLTGELQDAVVRSANEVGAAQVEQQRAEDKKMWRTWEDEGIDIIDLNDSEKKEWMDTVGYKNEMWAPYVEKYGADLFDEIIRFVNKV